MLERRHHRIGDDIIHEGCAAGAGIAQPSRLHRRRPPREYARPRTLGMAAQVNGDIYFHLAHPPRNDIAVQRRHVVELVEAVFQQGAVGAVVLAADGDGDDFEPRPVMRLDQRRDLDSHRMLVEVNRDIAQADAVMSVTLAPPQGRIGRGDLGLDDGGGAGLLQRLVIGIAQHGQRRRCEAGQGRADLVHSRPVAQVQRRKGAVCGGLHQVRLQRQRPVVIGQRILVAAKFRQRHAAIVKRARSIGLQRQGAVETGQCFLWPAQLRQDDAAIVKRINGTGIARQDVVEGRQRVGLAARAQQGMGIVRLGREFPRRRRHGAFQECYGQVKPAALGGDETQQVQHGKCAGIGAQDFATQLFGLVQPAGTVRRQRLFKSCAQVHGGGLDVRRAVR